MVFDRWYCPDCEKVIVVGTVAPRGVMHRHLRTKRHKANEEKRKAAQAVEQKGES